MTPHDDSWKKEAAALKEWFTLAMPMDIAVADFLEKAAAKIQCGDPEPEDTEIAEAAQAVAKQIRRGASKEGFTIRNDLLARLGSGEPTS